MNKVLAFLGLAKGKFKLFKLLPSLVPDYHPRQAYQRLDKSYNQKKNATRKRRNHLPDTSHPSDSKVPT
jgi:hypothetical protein